MRKRLDEVTILRPLAIFLVVFYHSFSIYDGKWPLPEGVIPSNCYNWLADIAYSFMLPLFVLMSGYLFSFQLNEKESRVTFISLLNNKFRRLLIPCYTFGILYLLIIQRPLHFHFGSIVSSLLDGVGHLWFLPMLFWCFIASYTLHRQFKLSTWQVLSLCLILYLVVPKTLPFRIGYSCWFFIYFEIGYYLRHNISFVRSRIKPLAAYSGIFYIVLFLIISVMFNHSDSPTGSIRYFYAAFNKIGSLGYGILGCIFVFCISLFITEKHRTLPKFISEVDKLCFGVYIYHQFILKILYYNTKIIAINTPFLPWCSLFVTILTSLLLAYITRLSIIGRKLIG